jgi:hypothetical protein
MKGSNVLTKDEKRLIINNDKRFEVPKLIYKKIEAKLVKYQNSLIDPDHVLRVNACIPQAADLAMETNAQGEQAMNVKKFCRAMNRITRAKGIRI